MDERNTYVSPFSSRYAGPDMQKLFSAQYKFSTWRKLWVILAESEMELGLPITEEQVSELKAHIEDIDFEKAAAYEKKLRHDVMSHVKTYGEVCPKAAGIIHLGATSCYVCDNTDIIILREGLLLLRRRLITLIRTLSAFAEQYKDLPTLAFTHFQPAQPTTVGKRATLWLIDLLADLEDLNYVLSTLKPLGCKGTTGTGASFRELFAGDMSKVRLLDQKIAEKMGFASSVAVSGQTYSRKTDTRVLSVLAQIAQSAHKFSNDIRLLAHMKEVEEPFEANQIGSSAMAYKRNPMRSERMAALSRFILCNVQNAAFTAAGQWLERTLDDSANRRLSIAEGFLATDSVLLLYENVASGLVVYPAVIRKHLNEELPFMATENLMMDAVKAGGNRQELHEKIRVHSMAAGKKIKEEGLPCDLLSRLAEDPAFPVSYEELEAKMNPSDYVGFAPEQVDDFLKEQVLPVLAQYSDVQDMGSEVNV